MNIVDTYFPPVKDANGRESTVLRIHHAIFFLLLTILIGSQVVSKFMMSGMQILLTVNWLIEGIYILATRKRGVVPSDRQSSEYGKESNEKCKTYNLKNWMLYAFLVLMGVHVVWLVGTANMDYGIDDLFKKLPLFVIPLVILTSRPLNGRQLSFVLFFYITTIFVSTIIGIIRLITIPDLPYRDIVPFISHIRFSLNICIAIVLLVTGPLIPPSVRPRPRGHSAPSTYKILSIVLILWFIVFLFILRSYTAFFVLFVTAWIMLFVYWRHIGERNRWYLLAMIVLTVTIATINVCYVRSYYGYDFTKMQSGLVENGNLLDDNICRAELEEQWKRRSAMDVYDTTPNGYTVYPTLVRYLNASGLSKDSCGISQLLERDIKLIEKGVANPVYADDLPMKKMCYVLLFEFENYRVNGSVRNSSLLERLALWRGAWRVFCENPIFGVGTGDGVDELHARLQADNSQIADTEKHAHNQYLSFLVSFGLAGFLLIAFAFLWAFRKMSLRKDPALFAIVVILLLSFISEDTMETLAGCVLCTVIPCLLAQRFGSQSTIKQSNH